jgi:hypothetical protein
MNVPDLSRIVDTFVPIVGNYFDILRERVIPNIRDLEKRGKLGWYSFLLHGADQLAGRAEEGTVCVHLRLEPMPGIEVADFISQLPAHFEKPIQVTVSEMGGVDPTALKDQNWAQAWRILGESSEWIVTLFEGHADATIPVQNIIQFMHFISNGLGVGGRFRFHMRNSYRDF